MMVGRISGFDGLRGLAASAVILHHYGYRGTALGDVAVLLFFVLSGFLIVGILHSMREEIEAGTRSAWMAVGEFWQRRARRIFPAFYFVFAVTLIGERWAGYLNLTDGVVWYLTFTQNFYVAWVQPFWLTLSHTWSIAVEQQFYLFVAPLLLAVPARLQWAFLLVLVAMGAGMTAALYGAGASDHALRILPFHGMAYIAAGGLTYFVSTGNVAKAPWAALAFVCVVILVVVSHPAWLPSGWGFTASAPMGNVLSILSCCGLICSCALDRDARWVRWLDWKPFAYLGTISYGLYIVHVPLAWVMANPIHGFLRGIGVRGAAYNWAFFSLIYVLSVVVASVLWFLVEKPILRYRGKPKERFVEA